VAVVSKDNKSLRYGHTRDYVNDKKLCHIRCPLCGGEVQAWDRVDTMALTHSLPPCWRFVDMTADKFLQWCRQTLEGN
jgi:hypothetical protein